MKDEFDQLRTYWQWCTGAIVVWLFLNRSPLVRTYPAAYALVSLFLMILILPSFLDYMARKFLLHQKYRLMLFCITPAVSIGEVMSQIPGNPFALGFPFALNLKALALLKLEKSAAAEKVLRRLVAYYENRKDKNPIRHARAMLLLCNALTQQGKLAESEEMSNKGIAILESQPDVSPQTLASSLCDLCTTLAKEGKANQAIIVGNRALALIEGMRFSDDGQLRLLGMVVNNLAVAYNYAGNSARAAELYQRSLDLKLKLFGSNSKEVVLGQNNVGYALLLQGQYVEACESLERAKNLAISLGLQNARIWPTVLGNCGDVHRALKRFDEAEKEQLEACTLREQTKSEELHESYYCLGKLYRDKEEFTRAEPYFEKALKMREKRFGEHPKVASVLEDFAKLKRAMKLESEAQNMEERAKVILKNFSSL